MAIKIVKNGRYWHATRYRIDWEAFDTVTGEMVNRNRANFNAEPTPQEEANKFAAILAAVEQDIADAAAEEAYEAKKSAYLAREGLGSDEELVKRCIDKQLSTSLVVIREMP